MPIETLDPQKSRTISGMILFMMAEHGWTVDRAMDHVCGEGSYKALADSMYDRLKAKAVDRKGLA